MPGACAPSTSVSMPRSVIALTICATGSTSEVVLVTWSTSTSFVRGVTAPSSRSTTISGEVPGNGMATTTTRAPARSATSSIAFLAALYA